MKTKETIFVTQPSLPPLEEFIPYLEKIWGNKILTNCGPFHEELEEQLCIYLGVKNISLFTNGTIALVTALQALRITGEVITTPYSFVATAHSLVWNNIKPVFVDIDPSTLNIDPEKIESAITPLTTAIMPVHCYGKPCDINAIQKIADKNNLKVIYDAAHAFGVKENNSSILNYGDLSVLSFHATKVFNTFEGGAIVSPDLATKKRIDQLKNFGFVDELTVVETGINGKMSEVNAAFGILQLKHLKEAIQKRKIIDNIYRNELSNTPGVVIPENPINTESNFSYFPILINNEYKESRNELYDRLKSKKIMARRYFHPLISELPMYKNMPSSNRENLKISYSISEKVLCLPIYPNLNIEDQQRIINEIKK